MQLIALLVLSAVGLALIAVGVTGHTGWTLIVAGFVAQLVALPPIWMIQRVKGQNSALSIAGQHRRCRNDRDAEAGSSALGERGTPASAVFTSLRFRLRPEHRATNDRRELVADVRNRAGHVIDRA
jgi:hypothetical protein